MYHYSLILLSLTVIFMGGWAQYPACSYLVTTMIGNELLSPSRTVPSGTDEYVCDAASASDCTWFSKNADPQGTKMFTGICIENWKECGAEYIKWTRNYKGKNSKGYVNKNTEFYHVNSNTGCVSFNCSSIYNTDAPGMWCEIYTPMSKSGPISKSKVFKYAV